LQKKSEKIPNSANLVRMTTNEQYYASFIQPNNGSKKLQKYTPKKSHTHAAECRYTFKIDHGQELGLLHMTNRQAI